MVSGFVCCEAALIGLAFALIDFILDQVINSRLRAI